MSDSNTMLVRAKSALLARDYTLAEKIYKNLILEEPDNISYKMQLGNLYVKAGKDDQALTIFKQIEKADNENLDALVAISGIYRRQKRYEESVAFLEQGLVICESSPKAHAKISYNLGFTYRQMGNYDGAIKCFEEVVEDNPSDVLANNHLGAIYALQGNHTQAIEAYNRGLKYDPNHPILQFNIAKSYAEIGEIAKAQSFYEGALRAKPGWTEAIEAYSDLLLVENKVAEADTVVNQALELYPDDVKMHTAKGNVFNRQSIFEHAEAEFKKALDVDETYKNALTGLAHSLENQGKLGEAIEVINKAEKMNPKDLKIKKQSAQIHISANELDTAFEKISKLREIDGNDVQTLNLLGQYYICKDDAAKAEECFANIKKINPDYNEIYRDWGKRFIQKGDEKKAEPYLHAAIQKNPSDSDAMVCLGELYEKQNQIGKALQFYKKASAADAFNERSKLASERILGNDENLASLDYESLHSSTVDYDSLFSGGKVSDNSEFAVHEDEESENSGMKLSAQAAKIISEAGEISLADNDAGFADETENFSEEEIPENPEAEKTSDDKDDFNFDQSGMEKLADTPSGAEDVSSVASLLESDENALDEDTGLDFDELIDDGAPIDEEDSGDMEVVSIPDDSEYLDDSNSIHSDAESPRSKNSEITEESLDKLEEQIKKANELAEKANNAAESALQAASHAEDAVRNVDEFRKKFPAEYDGEKVPQAAVPVYQVVSDAPAAQTVPVTEKDSEEPVEPQSDEMTDETVVEEEQEPAVIEERAEEEMSEEELNESEELADSDLLSDEGLQNHELLTEDDIAEAETEDDDFLDDIPDYLQEDDKETVAESEETEENSIEDVTEQNDLEESEPLLEDEPTEDNMEENASETEAPKIDDLTLRRAIDMLPSIIAAIEDRSVIYRFRAFLSMFKTLREMLDYLPPEQRHEFMTSRNRLLLDYVISKLSGKPGLYATTKALLRSGLIHENPENKPSEKDGIELVKEVLGNLRELSEHLEDETLREVLNNEADDLEEKI